MVRFLAGQDIFHFFGTSRPALGPSHLFLSGYWL